GEDAMGGNREFVLAIDITTGKEKWRTAIGTFYVQSNNWGSGPRGTPTVDGDFVYALSGTGDLACLERTAGKLVWSKNFKKDFKGGKGGWGYAESVLIDGDRLICPPGGREGAMAALNKKPGEPVWRSADFTDAAEYVSIMPLEVGGVRQYVTMTKNGTYGVRSKDGKRLWFIALGNNGTATIPTPLVFGNQEYVTAGYTGTTRLIKVTGSGDEWTAEKVYDTSKILRNHHGGVIKIGDFIYGHHSSGNAWVCVDFKTGAEKWKEAASPKQSVDK